MISAVTVFCRSSGRVAPGFFAAPDADALLRYL
jgi:hypothetical protein